VLVVIRLFKNYKLIEWRRNDQGGAHNSAKVSKDFFILGSDFEKGMPKTFAVIYDKKTLDLIKVIDLEYHICLADPKNDLILANVRPSSLDNNVTLYKFCEKAMVIQPIANFSSSVECPNMEESSVAQNSSIIVAACWDSPGVRYLSGYNIAKQQIQWQRVIVDEPPSVVAKYEKKLSVQVLMTEKFACIYIEQV